MVAFSATVGPALRAANRSGNPPLRQLLLLRHAKAAPGAPGLGDHARPLDERGRLAASSMRDAMRGLGLLPDVVLVSSARRTLQTLEALGPWDETPIIEPMNGLYLAELPRMLAVLQGVSDTVRSLLLIGHNPGLHDLAMLLAGAHAMASNGSMASRLAGDFPTGALAEFTVARDWRALGEGSGKLVRFLCPRDLPEMAR